MWSALRIQHFALISQLNLTIEPGFTVLTGETGAGKSILLGALQLALGGRSDSSKWVVQGKKCVVEADFNLAKSSWESWFAQEDLDFEPVTTLRREISATGKSRAFINDTPVKLTVIRDLSESLIDIHSQVDSAKLTRSGFVAGYLDRMTDSHQSMTTYQDAWLTWQGAKADWARLEVELQSVMDEEYLRFLHEELQAAQLEPDEEKQWQDELQTLSHAEDLMSDCEEARALIESPEQGLQDMMGRLQNLVTRMAGMSSQFHDMTVSGQEALTALEDMLRSMDDLFPHLQSDPGRLSWLEDRLSMLDALQRKHQVADVKSLLEKQAALGFQLDGLHAAGDRRASLSQALVDSKSAVMAAANQLHIDRLNHVDVVTSAVEKTLKSLNMPDASLAIDCQELPQPSKDGLWQYHFMFSANKGSKPMPIAKVASGGEQSRLMLALKKLFVEKKGLQTMLFDEIDSGISGQTASKVAGIFQEMGMQGQILAITHLPQVAAAGQHHWLVDKQGQGGQTETSLRILDKKDRQLEVARMLAGDAITETALAQASNLLGTS